MGSVISNYELHDLLVKAASAARKLVEDNPIVAEYELPIEHAHVPVPVSYSSK